MKIATCRGCGGKAHYLVIDYCSTCLDQMMRIMQGRD